MQWILLSLLSAVFLGLYDVARKSAVRDNAVPPVLLLNVLTTAIIWLPLVLLSRWTGVLEDSSFYVDRIDPQTHGLLFLKSLLVGASWMLAFFALKHLPISIAAPIRSTSPFWIVLVATSLLGERPGQMQWLGMLILLAAFFAFSRVGQREGVHFRRNKWIVCIVLATVLGALSALYDKYLLQTCGIRPSTVQAWFSIYLVLVMLPLNGYWVIYERSKSPFQWRWTIPAIAIALLVTDYLYFLAITDADAMIAIISPVRRTSVIIPFTVGILWLREKNARPKAICIALMLLGVLLLSQ